MLLWTLCVAAAVRVLTFSAAFPPFNNVDERLHFDSVVKYSQGHIPRGFETFSHEAARLGVLFSSPEFRFSPNSFPDGMIPAPAWQLDPRDSLLTLKEKISTWEGWTNIEGTQPPLYYILTGAWYRAGKWLGLREADGIYWVRFLNAPFVVLLIWFSYRGMKLIFPEQKWQRLGMALLIAFFPQMIFYGINNDVLSPLLFAAAFFSLLNLLGPKPRDYGAHAQAGLLVAATLMVKLTNVGILAVLGAVLFVQIKDIVRTRRHPRAQLPREEDALPCPRYWAAICRPVSQTLFNACCLILSMAIPLFIWCAWNYHTIGDWTGQGGTFRAKALGWTSKPASEWFRHPIFTVGGFGYFLNEFILSFWRGELLWHGASLSSRYADWIYVGSSWLFLAEAAIGLSRKKRPFSQVQRTTCLLAFLAFAASVAFLVYISIAYEFPTEGVTIPTRAIPFLTSGRWALGAMIPFFILYLKGLEDVCRFLRVPREWALISIVFFSIVFQTALMGKVFQSPYNWFHLPANPSITEAIR